MKRNSWSDYPHLLADLDMDKNKNHKLYRKSIDVLDLVAGTGKKLDWKCFTCDHEWEATGDSRIQGNGCPACFGRLHSDGRNSMFSTHPDLAKEYQGNAKLVVAGTNKKLDWKCITCNHEWNAIGSNRVNGNGCPACAGQRIHSDGRNSMFNTHPQLAKEYQGDANLVTAGTGKKLDWKCLIISDTPCDHVWSATSTSRVTGNGCPGCSGRVVHIDGRNSMFNTHPELALEYQGDANLVLAGTDRLLDWQCRICEHTWNSAGYSRLSGSGCPACANQCLHIDGRNSMFNTHPFLAKEYQGDAKLIVAGTNTKLDWKCSTCNHKWKTNGSHRVLGRGCAHCAKTGYDPSQIGYVYIHQYVDDTTHWLKCGITGKPLDRFKRLSKAASTVNIEVEQLDIYTFDNGLMAQECERELLNTLELRFTSEYDIEGKAEFFKYSALAEIKNIIGKYL